MRQSHKAEFAAHHRKPPVHRVNILHLLRRPEPFGDGSHARPDPRVDISGIREFGPHARFAAQDARLLFRRQAGGGAFERIDRVVPRGRLHEVQIVARREDTHVALARGAGERLLAAPGLHHNVLGQSGVQNLVPPNRLLAVLLDNAEHAPAEIGLQIVVGLFMRVLAA